MNSLTAPAHRPARPLRADAERNRLRILEAAADLFARRGLEVGLDEIARHAGVGTGTVYRRFGDKEALITALVEVRVDAVLRRADEALAEPDAWTGFTGLMATMVEMQLADRGLHDAFAEHHERLLAKLGAVLGRARDQGELRPDVELGDLAALQVMLHALGAFADLVDPDQWRRQLALLLDGFRTRRDAPAPLGHPALSIDDLSRIRDR